MDRRRWREREERPSPNRHGSTWDAHTVLPCVWRSCFFCSQMLFSLFLFWPSLEAQLNCPVLRGVFCTPGAACPVLSELFPIFRALSTLTYNSRRWPLLLHWVTHRWGWRDLDLWWDTVLRHGSLQEHLPWFRPPQVWITTHLRAEPSTERVVSGRGCSIKNWGGITGCLLSRTYFRNQWIFPTFPNLLSFVFLLPGKNWERSLNVCVTF